MPNRNYRSAGFFRAAFASIGNPPPPGGYTPLPPAAVVVPQPAGAARPAKKDLTEFLDQVTWHTLALPEMEPSSIFDQSTQEPFEGRCARDLRSGHSWFQAQ